MLFKLALKNIFHSKSYFLAYAITISGFSVLIYSITVIQQSFTAVLNSSVNEGFTVGVFFAQYFIYFIILSFSFYIIHFFTRRRRKEIALYKMFGLNSWKIFEIFAIENAIVILISFILSIILGMIFSRFLLMITAAYLQVEMQHFPFQLSILAIKSIAISLIITYVMMNLIPIRFIWSANIKKLFEKGKNKQKQQRFPFFSFAALIITSSFLIYWLYFIPDISNPFYFFLIFLISIVVVFFMYRGLFYVSFYFIKKRKLHFQSPISLLTTNHFMSNIQSLNFILSLVTVLTAIIASFITIIFGAVDLINIREQYAKELNVEGNLTYAIFQKESRADFLELEKTFAPNDENFFELSALLYPNEHPQENAPTAYVFISQDMMLSYINQTSLDFKDSISDMQNLSSEESIIISEGSDKYEVPYAPYTQNAKYFISQTFSDFLKSDYYYFGNYQTLPTTEEKVYNEFANTVPIIISNEDFENLTKKEYIQPFHLFISKKIDFKSNLHQELNFITSIYDYNNTNDEKIFSLQYYTFFQTAVVIIVYASIQVIFLTILIAVIIALIMTLFFRTLEVVENNLEEYQIASLIGLNKQQIFKSILIETAFTQLLPFYCGIIGGLIVFGGASKFIFNDNVADMQFSVWSVLFTPATRLLFIIFIVAIHILYISLNYNIHRKLEQRNIK